MKEYTIRIEAKDPDQFGAMAHGLGWDDDTRRRFLEFGEYAEFELTVDETGHVRGQIVRRK